MFAIYPFVIASASKNSRQIVIKFKEASQRPHARRLLKFFSGSDSSLLVRGAKLQPRLKSWFRNKSLAYRWKIRS